MSNSYKKAMDKIVLSDEMIKSIINNTSKAANKKKQFKLAYLQKAAGLAACFAICLLSYFAVTNYIKSPKETITPSVNTSDKQRRSDNKTQILKSNEPMRDEAIDKTQNEKPSDIALTPPKVQTPPQIHIDDTQPPSASENPTLGTAPISGTENQTQLNDNYTVFEGNPLQNTTDTAQIEAELGYSIKIPAYIPKNYQISDMCVIADSLAQITYKSEGDTICYRTAKGNDDISGDYNKYNDIEKININNSEVTVNGNDNLYYKASWSNGDQAFSVCSDGGIDMETMINIVSSIN